MTTQFLIENSWLIATAVISGGLIVWQSVAKGGSNGISPAVVTQLMNHKKAVLVDIRDADAIAQAGALPEAKRIALADLKAKADSLSKNKETPVVVVCQTGQRSGAAATVLKAAGYSQVFTLEGGVAAWVEAGMPVKKTKAA